MGRKSRIGPVSGLSYLDLLCCGLGAVTMLFMILVALKGTIQFGPPPAPGPPAEGDVSPFVVVLAASGPEALFTSTPTDGASRFSIEGPEFAVRTDSCGSRHAFLVAERPPRQDAKVKVGPISPSASFDVQVVFQGRAIWRSRYDPTENPAPLGPGGVLAIWPEALATRSPNK